MDTHYWIIGAGRFGRIAFERLKKKDSGSSITLVDNNPEALHHLEGCGADLICSDAADFLVDHMDDRTRAHWIIPAVPIHLAMTWVFVQVTTQTRISLCPVPDTIAKILPNPIPGAEGQLYVSYADFICPDNCREPYDRCTFTGKPRKGFLYQKIEALSSGSICPVVIQSRQLAPGVGGYTPEDLERGVEKVLACKPSLVLFSTACFCHGVIHAMTFSPE